MTSQADIFKRRLRNLEQARRNYNPGGRNRVSSHRAIQVRYELMIQMVLTSDEVCDMLDNSPTVARRWNRIERQMVGLPV